MRVVSLTVLAFALCGSSAAFGAVPAGSTNLPCLGEVCLGESIQNLRNIPWIALPAGTAISFLAQEEIATPKGASNIGNAAVRQFPRFEVAHPDLAFWPAPPNFAGLTLLAKIKSKSNLTQLNSDLRQETMLEPNRVGRDAILELTDARPAFCDFIRLTGHFLSKSGYATTVVFMPVARSAADHDLVVEYIGRRVPMAPEASAEFEKMLKHQYSYLVKSDDLRQAPCGQFGCTIGDTEPGKSLVPNKWTAIEAALISGRDYIEYFTPPDIGYADFELEVSPVSPSWDKQFRASLQYSQTALVPNRFPNIALSQHPMCKPPKPVVPPLE